METRKYFNRIPPTPSMFNVSLTKHKNNNKTHAYLPHTELPLNVIDYYDVRKQILMNSNHSINTLKQSKNEHNLSIQQSNSQYKTFPRMNYQIHHSSHEQEQQNILNSFDFFNEINRFKLRLNILEKERFELEDKVQRLQAENTSYKNLFLNETNDRIGSRSTTVLNGHMTSMAVTENDIERLKRRIETLVKSNDEKERKIEDLQIQLTKCQPIPLTPIPSLNIQKIDNYINNHTIQKISYEADGDISDSNSVPSLNSDKDSQLIQKPLSIYNGYDSSQNQSTLLTLHRASSAEPMLKRELTTTPISNISQVTFPSNKRNYDKHDQSGYISDGPSQKYSLYKKTSSTNLDKNKSSSAKGLKSIFGRIIRTSSGNIRDDNEQQIQSSFQRGGLRATITNGSTSSKTLSPIETTFAHWQTEQIVNWLYGIDLGQYAGECRKHFKNGLQLLHATPQELEKKIGMRNPIHRKKLQLCLNGLCTSQTEANSLDTYWVQKWLDDIGLPQYKEYFAESKVDGRILNNLTLEDIIYLNITNELHHLSIKRSIQVLRLNDFNPTCIKRRPNPNDKNNINEIMYWSNHRVMEWLRSIDLSEYAPNLRGSGVCGALIVLELRFNVSTLAEILSIPMSKTLLRRHLTMRFQELIGNDLQNRKNQYEKSPNCQPLTLHTKVKFPRGLFAHRRARSVDTNELVCPMNDNSIPNGISPSLKLFQSKESSMTDDLENELALTLHSPTTVV
ncbi:unnamed protein product [Adineta steineri]|uniref:SAM domain-containing protein n=1 Tax=Adineta steineri TaxID=433720 RepID=A0A818V407_9BILA|nr:unnamed protein product [Adineta steineri]CAF3700917.1 unnamed protein product [Adineta steineri]